MTIPPGSPDDADSPTELAETTFGSADPGAEIASLGDASFDGRYQAGEALGRGGMGEVRAFTDRRLGREIAVKLLHEHVADSSDAVPRFLREARVQGQLQHPAVVPVYDLGIGPNDRPFLAMKRVSGETLAAVIARHRRADDFEATTRGKLLGAFVRVCQAVEFAHSRGVVHRDLKPGNIMLGDFGEVYVLDWGLARLEGMSEPAAAASPVASDDTPAPITDPGDATPRTADGVVMGTPGYMAPEQLRGTGVGPGADVYALGAILYELLTLEPLHPRADALASTVAGADARASERVPDAEVPPELEALCVAATTNDAGARPTVADLAAAVDRYLAGDRDLARRRELAAEHAARAAAALSGEGDENRRRRDAMREAGRSLALDPENREAAATLASLLLQPPEKTPPAVEEALARSQFDAGRQEARLGAFSLSGMLLFVPFMLWMGAPEPLSIALLAATLVVSAWWAIHYSRRAEPSRPLLYLALAPMTLLIFVITRLFGPLFVAPALGGIMVMSFRMHGLPRLWKTAALAFAVAVAAPLALQLAGVIAPTYRFAAGALIVAPAALTFSRTPALIVMALIAAGFLLVPGLIIDSIMGRIGALERQVHLQVWHLRQMLPEHEAPTEPAACRRP